MPEHAHASVPPVVDAAVRLSGELDVTEQASLSQSLRDAIDAADDAVVVDLSDVQFMDSSAITAFLLAARKAAEDRVEFRVVGANDRVRRVLEVSGLIGVPPFGD